MLNEIRNSLIFLYGVSLFLFLIQLRYIKILNLEMLDSNENESKGQKYLKDWIDEKCLDNKTDTRERILESHLIPNVDLSLENFPEFIEERSKLLKEKLKTILIKRYDSSNE